MTRSLPWDAILIALLIVLVAGVLLVVGRRRSPAAPGAVRWDLIVPGIGCGLLVVVAAFEVRAVLGEYAPVVGAPTLHRLVEPGDTTAPPDRLQAVVAFHHLPDLHRPVEVHERIAPMPYPGSGGFAIHVPSIPLDGEVHASIERGGRLEYDYEIDAGPVFSRHYASGSTSAGSGFESMAPDGRPFLRVPVGFRQPGKGLSNLCAPGPRMALCFLRPLYPGDVLEEAATAEMVAAFGGDGESPPGPDLRFDLLTVTDGEEPKTDPVWRVATSASFLMACLVVAAFGFLSWGRVTKVQGVGVLMLVVLLGISASGRFQLWYHAHRLESESADVRCRAAANLASIEIFPERVGRLLADRFRREPDARVRSALMISALAGGGPVSESAGSRAMRRDALAAPHPEAAADLLRWIDDNAIERSSDGG